MTRARRIMMAFLMMGLSLLTFTQVQAQAEDDSPFLKTFSQVERYENPKPIPFAEFNDLDGKRLSWDHFAGKYVLLNLWADWCLPCIEELPSLARLSKRENSEHFAVVAIAIDTATEPKDIADNLKRINAADLPLYTDLGQSVAMEIYAPTIPITYILDPKGKILYRMSGPAEWDTPEAAAFLKQVTSSK